MNDEGVYRIENCRGARCEVQNAERKRNGRVDLSRSLTVSSDVYYYRMADAFWNQTAQFGQTPVQDAATRFGLGRKTGIALTGESAGRLPTPQARREAYEARPDLFMTGDWRTGDNINTSIGQGDVLATPLQIVNSYSTFANGGKIHRPQVVAKVTRPSQILLPPDDSTNYKVMVEEKPVVSDTVEIDPGAYSQIYNGLLGVTQNDDGTAAIAWNSSPTAWPMAGKTGTAQVAGKADTALFVGWGPAQPGVAPRFAISVVVPEAGFGGSVAAPIAFRILQPISFGQVPPACPTVEEGSCATNDGIEGRSEVLIDASD